MPHKGCFILPSCFNRGINFCSPDTDSPPLSPYDTNMINWHVLSEKKPLHVMVDLGMLGLIGLHLLLVGFDLSYFALRDWYVHYLPSVQQNYDRMKGVEPHRFTVQYVQKAEAAFQACSNPTQNQLLSQELITLSRTMIDEDPFKLAQKSGQLERIKQRMAAYTHVNSSYKQAFTNFWQHACQNPEVSRPFFDQQIAALMRLNYWRRIDVSGQYVDHFVRIDLIFISIFLLEFLFMWGYAIRRLGPEQKVLYPLTHWYDLVSCIPLRQLYFLRLLRLLTLYYRLLQSRIIRVEQLKIYRSYLKYKNIVIEEISDQVNLDLIKRTQIKVRRGANRQLMERIYAQYREQIRAVLIQHLQQIKWPNVDLHRTQWEAVIAELLHVSLTATDEYRGLIRLPFIGSRIAQAVSQDALKTTVHQSSQAMVLNLKSHFSSPSGEQLLAAVVDDYMEQAMTFLRQDSIQNLLEDIHLEILDELKKSVRLPQPKSAEVS